jgi:prephenate dehydrogenase
MMELYGRSLMKDRVLDKAVGPGFRDFTRIAAGHPVMWADILRLNAREIAKVLKAFRIRLQSLEKEVASGNRRHWESFFGNAKRLREKL